MKRGRRVVKLQAGAKGFAEDKDEAKRLRNEVILPSLWAHQSIIIDFSEVTSSTQSFVHALLGEALQKFGEAALTRLEFRSCAPQVRSLVQLVVDYSLGGFIIGSESGPMELATGGTDKNVSSEPPAPRRSAHPRHPKAK